MKKFVISIWIVFTGFQGFSQFHHNLELGGSNFLGIGVNTSYQFNLCEKSPLYLAPQLGVGQIFYWENPMTLQFGLTTGYALDQTHSIEFNSSASYLFESPFFPYKWESYTFPDGLWQEYIWSNSFDYRFKPKKIRYVIGAGFLLGVNKYEGSGGLKIAGDGLPMVKIGIGI